MSEHKHEPGICGCHRGLRGIIKNMYPDLDDDKISQIESSAEEYNKKLRSDETELSSSAARANEHKHRAFKVLLFIHNERKSISKIALGGEA